MACNFEENKFIKSIECTVRGIKADYYRKQMISALKRIREYTRRDEFAENEHEILRNIASHIEADAELLNEFIEIFGKLFDELKRADAMAQSEKYRWDKVHKLNVLLPLIEEILEQQQCFSLKDLAVNGGDLMAAGVAEGKQIGIILNKLMDMVIDEEVVNNKEVLLEIACELKNNI